MNYTSAKINENEFLKRYLVKIESVLNGECVYLEEYAQSKSEARNDAKQHIKSTRIYI